MMRDKKISQLERLRSLLVNNSPMTSSNKNLNEILKTGLKDVKATLPLIQRYRFTEKRSKKLDRFKITTIPFHFYKMVQLFGMFAVKCYSHQED